jgi:hypothetical protein
MSEYAEAKRALDRLHRELMELNPSAARSLEEGMGTSQYCSKNCAASDRARKKRLQNVANMPKVPSIDSETCMDTGDSL